MPPSNLKAALEALLFSSDEPLSLLLQLFHLGGNHARTSHKIERCAQGLMNLPSYASR